MMSASFSVSHGRRKTGVSGVMFFVWLKTIYHLNNIEIPIEFH